MFGWLKRAGSATTAAGLPHEIVTEADRLREQGSRVASKDAYLRAHRAQPDNLYVLYWLATLEQELGDSTGALEHCRRGLALDPDQIGLLMRTAAIAASMDDDVTALMHYERVAGLDPDVPGIDALLADRYCRLGRLREGHAAFDRALARSPEDVTLQQNRLFVRNYGDASDPQRLFDEHRAWGEMHEAPLRSTWMAFDNERDPGRRLKIGFVSGDLRDHAVASFLLPLFRHHDRDRFEFHCFDTSPHQPDEVTRQLREQVSAWRHIGHLGDEALASQIREDGIDVLIDLAGHTKGNRLLVFARRSAPVQATWLGYLNTSGLAAMDYRITDAALDPPGETEHLHTERLWRLETHACFSPSDGTPEVAPSPAGTGQPLTFGSLNQWPKVSAACRDLWARILVAVPESRLFVVVRGSGHEAVRSAILNEFTSRGARADQVLLFPFMSTVDFLNLVSRVDIALDPFPYGGGTTTMQCLWMGTPVVTLRGCSAMSRNSLGALEAVGLAHLIADSPAEYLDKAAALGRDTAELRALRQSLRKRMACSRLVDGAAFARSFERALRAMWLRYCGLDP